MIRAQTAAIDQRDGPAVARRCMGRHHLGPGSDGQRLMGAPHRARVYRTAHRVEHRFAARGQVEHGKPVRQRHARQSIMRETQRLGRFEKTCREPGHWALEQPRHQPAARRIKADTGRRLDLTVAYQRPGRQPRPDRIMGNRSRDPSGIMKAAKGTVMGRGGRLPSGPTSLTRHPACARCIAQAVPIRPRPITATSIGPKLIVATRRGWRGRICRKMKKKGAFYSNCPSSFLKYASDLATSSSLSISRGSFPAADGHCLDRPQA